ncbi:hypothetical protein CHLRE_06g268850v5 [Chlamydomonas reinhardtii]|uniref:Protein kinase domain-containing protein n=1 Tax=Chlamydomonas reinhardtii TaxID=3055 RepID=A0A2K3DN64_CHLRE|nr:uncharacterized protein CHLRE_06g268850v5 [Chlamydomonas reinhardtii]PNW81979.1 hypothetical protein CHLRE_06g268850v5 [Chlamydomonas reinhardtii]
MDSHLLRGESSSVCLKGMWCGAQASIKLFRANSTALTQLGGALSALQGNMYNHPSAHPGTDPCSPCAAADAVAAEAVPVSDLLLSFQTLGDCAPPSTGCSATPVAAAAAAGNSRTMESILGSAFECCLPLPDDGGALTGAEAARLVTDALQPSPGDCVVALVSELCLLGDLRSALRAGVFNSSSNSSSCSRPHDTSSAPGVAAAALSRSCSGGGPGPTSAAAIRRAAGGAAAAGGGMAGWTPARAVRAVVATAREAALGVLHLHSCGAAHGNLRPSNIQLMEAHTDRRGFVAKVSDAGLGPRHSELGPDLRTYTAPEALVWGLWAPSRADMQAADVYSFGVILFEMISGRRPTAQDLQILACAGTASGEEVAGGPSSTGAGGPSTGAGRDAAAQYPHAPPTPPSRPSWPEGWDPCVLPPKLLHLCGWCLQPDAAARPRMDVVASQLTHTEAQLRAAAAEAKRRAVHAPPPSPPPPSGGANCGAGAGAPPLGAAGALWPASANAVMHPAAAGGAYSTSGVHLVVRSVVGMTPPVPIAASLQPVSVRAAVGGLPLATPESGGLSTGALYGREPLLAACGGHRGLQNAESLDWSALPSEDWG